MSALDRKLMRDLAGMWSQALAISLVLAAGVATLILAVGAYRSLDETRAAYYERYRFAHVFAYATRAPRGLMDRISELPGVASAEARIVKHALLDIDGFEMPATGLVTSLPAQGEPVLNRLFMRSGRLPQEGETGAVTVNEDFAEAHGFTLGSSFQAILNGRKQTLHVVGVALSPEFIFATGPGDFVPDDRRFGILWMNEKVVEASFDLENAFNSVSLQLRRDASEPDVLKQLDDLLARYGGTAAYGRKDHFSHAFLDAELDQLTAMGRVLPPIFLIVTVFLINMILSRLIALEREQIGLLKALGYSSISIAMHYMKLVLLIAGIGILIGFGLGTWLGDLLTRAYAASFHFPFLVFQRNVDVYVLSAAISFAAAALGALRAVWQTMALSPAVAMQPPAPARYRRLWHSRTALLAHVSQLTVMVLRHIVRAPLRALVTTFGISLSSAVLVTCLFPLDAVDFMMDVTFFQSERQDATVTFGDVKAPRVLESVGRLPGVMAAEPYRAISARIRNGQFERRTSIVGRPKGTDLSRILNLDMEPVTLPESGLALTDKLAELLGVGRGDIVKVEFLEGRRSVVDLPVSEVFESYVGLSAYMEMSALSAVLDEGPVVSGVHIAIDTASSAQLYEEVKNTPALSSIALLKVSLQQFRKTMAENINFTTYVYVVLGMIIAFGVAYNSARIQLSERSRELASLRVLGFTRAEVARILTIELALFTLVGIPVGWVVGYGFAWMLVQGFENELYRLPFVIERSTYAQVAVVVLAAVIVSMLIVRRRINNLDLIEVLKTRE